MTGTLYGVGVGPGDPGLVTPKAMKAMESCQAICLPKSGDGEALAFQIARAAMPSISEKEILEVSMPMSRDRALLEEMHGRAAQAIAERLGKGDCVAFLTIGDPTVYSTYMYVHERVARMGYPAEIIPGVPSFAAAAARLSISLTEASEPLVVVPASYEGWEKWLDLPGTKVLMKSGRSIESVKAAILERGLESQTCAVSNCGLEGERVIYGVEGLDASYFTVIVIKPAKEEPCSIS
jgi:precorrin-2/cobalt-factor-2 C20-methyltransferase